MDIRQKGNSTKMKKVNILGTEWSIVFGSESDYPALKDFDGYCDSSVRKIVIDDMLKAEGDISKKEDIDAYQNQVIRHELLHAYLEESRLSSSSLVPGDGWATNEEMIDWFAIQAPKIFKLYSKLDILKN